MTEQFIIILQHARTGDQFACALTPTGAIWDVIGPLGPDEIARVLAGLPWIGDPDMTEHLIATRDEYRDAVISAEVRDLAGVYAGGCD